jgi:hypothetical protein
LLSFLLTGPTCFAHVASERCIRGGRQLGCGGDGRGAWWSLGGALLGSSGLGRTSGTLGGSGHFLFAHPRRCN